MEPRRLGKRTTERRVSHVWPGVHCALCRWPVLLVCHDPATNDWRPRCVNAHCKHARAAALGGEPEVGVERRLGGHWIPPSRESTPKPKPKVS